MINTSDSGFAMKIIVPIIFGMILPLTSFAQVKFLQIDRSVNEYYADTLYNQIDFSYSNLSDSVLVLWIEKTSLNSFSDSQRIKEYFFTKKGDWYLMQIIWDGNVSAFVPGLFDSFIKLIRPNEKFTITVLKKGTIDSDLINSIPKHIMVTKAGNIRGFPVDSSIEMFNYKANSLTIMFDLLK